MSLYKIFGDTHPLSVLYTCNTLTYLDISSRLRSFMSVGIIFVASSPELYGFGSWPLNSDRRNCRFQLKNKIYAN